MTVHRSLPHDSGPLHVAGAARYADDVPLPPGVVHLAFGTSERARARIISVDLGRCARRRAWSTC